RPRNLAGIGRYILRGGSVMRHQRSLSIVLPAAAVVSLLAWGVPGHFLAQASTVVDTLRAQADLRALQGLLALEAGQTREAAADFRQALALWEDEATAASRAGLDFGGRKMAQKGLELIGDRDQ